MFFSFKLESESLKKNIPVIYEYIIVLFLLLFYDLIVSNAVLEQQCLYLLYIIDIFLLYPTAFIPYVFSFILSFFV